MKGLYGALPAPVVLAAPSGTGKTTLARRLVQESDHFVFSVSATTRSPREGEVDGVDYHFLDPHAFEEMIREDRLAEWAQVHGRYYGTPRAELEKAASGGRHAVLDIDIQGARQIREAVPEALLLFVMPPSVDELLRRLRVRGTEPDEEVARRLRSALRELLAAPEFDYVVVNDDLDGCLGEIRGIIRAEGFRTRRMGELQTTVEEMRTRIGAVLRDEYREADIHEE